MNTSPFFAPPADDVCLHEDSELLVTVATAPSGIYFTTQQHEWQITKAQVVRMLGTDKGVTLRSALECEACGNLCDVEFDIDNEGAQVVTAVR